MPLIVPVGFQRSKFKSLVHYVCWMTQDNPARLGATKLNKVLWRAETQHYMASGGDLLTGARFIKEKRGPVAAAMLPIIEELIEEGKIEQKRVKVIDHYRTEYITKEDPDIQSIPQSDIREVSEALNEVCQMTAKAASLATHNEPWNLAELGEDLPLFTSFALAAKVTDGDLEWADQKIAGARGVGYLMVIRTVIQDREVSQDIVKAKASYSMVDEVVSGIEWTLARDPGAGLHRKGEYWVYAQNGFKIHRIPEIVVLYSFTDNEVTLHACVFREGK